MYILFNYKIKNGYAYIDYFSKDKIIAYKLSEILKKQDDNASKLEKTIAKEINDGTNKMEHIVTDKVNDVNMKLNDTNFKIDEVIEMNEDISNQNKMIQNDIKNTELHILEQNERQYSDLKNSVQFLSKQNMVLMGMVAQKSLVMPISDEIPVARSVEYRQQPRITYPGNYDNIQQNRQQRQDQQKIKSENDKVSNLGNPDDRSSWIKTLW